MDSDRGLSPATLLVTSVFKGIKSGHKQFKRLGNLIKSKTKTSHNESCECVDDITPIHYFTPSSSFNSPKTEESNHSNSTTISNSIESKDIHSNSDNSALDDEILEQLVKAEYDRNSNNHPVYEIGNSTPSTENCKCNICSFYNGMIPPSMTGIDPDMYPKCIYKNSGSKGIFGIKNKLVGAKKTLYKYLNH